jgi:hypothetical protein
LKAQASPTRAKESNEYVKLRHVIIWQDFKAERNICQRENLHIRMGPIESTHCPMIHKCLGIELETFVRLLDPRVSKKILFFHIVKSSISHFGVELP